VRSIRDFAQVQQEDVITFERTESTLRSLGIDGSGLDNVFKITPVDLWG